MVDVKSCQFDINLQLFNEAVVGWKTQREIQTRFLANYGNVVVVKPFQ